MPGPQELILILLLVVVIFGAKKLPALGKGLGQGIRNFKTGLSNGPEDSSEESEDSSGQ